MDPELHNISHEGRTPFINVLEVLTSTYLDFKPPPLIGCLGWLVPLALAKVDLMEYGRRECNLLEEGKVSREWKGVKWGGDWDTRENLTWTLERLRCSTSPFGWGFIIGLVEEEISSDVEKIPGAWMKDNISEANVLGSGDSEEILLEDDSSEDEDFESNDHGEEDSGETHHEETTSDMECSNSVKLEDVDSEDKDSELSNLEGENPKNEDYMIYRTEKGHLKKEFCFEFSNFEDCLRTEVEVS